MPQKLDNAKKMEVLTDENECLDVLDGKFIKKNMHSWFCHNNDVQYVRIICLFDFSALNNKMHVLWIKNLRLLLKKITVLFEKFSWYRKMI